MSKLLLVGESYPVFSCRAAGNLKIAEELREAGHEVYLLSRSWCTVTQENFYGDAGMLCNAYPFKKRFFADAVQLRATGTELFTAMLGLCIQILEQEQIDAVVFSDPLSFLPIAECCRSRFGIPCFLFLFDEANDARQLFDDYMFPVFEHGLRAFDRIFTFSSCRQVLSETFHYPEENIISCLPYSCPERGPDVPADVRSSVCVLTEPFSFRNARQALSCAKQSFSTLCGSVFLCTPNGSGDAAGIGTEPDCCVAPGQVPSEALVVFASELITPHPIGTDRLLLALSHGRIPVIGEQSLARFRPLVRESSPLGDYLAVRQLSLPGRNVAAELTSYLSAK